MQELDLVGEGANSPTKTIRFHAVMRWVPTHQQWFMYNAADNKFITYFFDSENISRIFPDIQKDKENIFNLYIEKIGTHPI